jgi:precorrin-2/cobalt-factor-2 C20-methyltransferase
VPGKLGTGPSARSGREGSGLVTGIATARRLVGVGVGPGDPELVTIKAVRVLSSAGLVLVPVMAGAGDGEPGRAEATVRAHIDGARIRRVPFALSDRGGVTPGRQAAWSAAARAVAAAFAAGTPTVAFATIGDPNIYSTFSYLAQTVRGLVPDVTIDTVPGITAMQDLASRAGTVLAEGSESLVLLPLCGVSHGAAASPDTPLRALQAALDHHDTVVAYKLGGTADAATDIPALLAALRESGRLDGAVYGARLGLPGEDIRPAGELSGLTRVPYLSTLIAPGHRTRTGGKLR